MHGMNDIAGCVGMRSNEFPSTESQSHNSLVKIDIWVIGEYLVNDVERDRNIGAIDGECLHKIEEGIFQEMSNFL